MVYLVFILWGLLLNDTRILLKIYDNNIQHIKYKLIRTELGFNYLLICIFLNFFKGFLPFYFLSEDRPIVLFFLASILITGVFLGALPGKTEGSELIVLIGILAAVDYHLIRLPLSLYFSSLFLIKSNTLSLFIFILTVLLNCLHLGYYYMFLLAGCLMVNYTFKNYELFLPFKNIIKGKIFS